MQSTRPMGISFKYIDIDAIDNTKCKIQQVKTLETKDAPSRATRYTEIGDVLFSMVRPYLRNIAKVTESDCIASTGFFVCSTNGSIVADYCYYLMISDYVVNGLNQFMKGDNSPSINNKHIATWLYPIPPLAEQERIVAGIEKWFALIDQIEQGKVDLQTAIKQTKSKILDLAIHGKLVPQDPNEEPASELLKRINPKAETTCDNGHYQKLPKGWAKCKLSNLCKIENGYAFSSSDYKQSGTPLVRISNITHNIIDLSECVFVQDIVVDEKFKISQGDLLIAMSGATTGKMGIYTYKETAYLNQRVGNIRILDSSILLPLYRDCFMQSKVEEILKLAYGGAQPNISASVIGDFEFLLPPINEQKRIVEAIDITFKHFDAIMESL